MDKYATLSVVGEGTYGMVMKCVDLTTGQLVAVKKLRNALQDSLHCQMIVREFSLLRTLSNDHVVQMVDSFRHNGHVYMVFPLMRCSLFRHLELSGGSLVVDEAKEYVYQVLKGLDYMHNRKIVHRDVKPENVLLSAGGVVKICDFGASRLFSPDQTQLELSSGIGTVWYQAPEILMNSKKYGTEVDIWSVGILFTELVNGLPLITEETIADQLFSVAELLGYDGEIMSIINSNLHAYGVHINTVAQNGPTSKSYTVSNTIWTLHKVFNRWPTYLLEIVANCLQLDPVFRKSAAQLLDMKFFTLGMFITQFERELAIKLKYDRISPSVIRLNEDYSSSHKILQQETNTQVTI